MPMKASEKIIESLAQLMEGFTELQEAVEAEYDIDESEELEDESGDARSEADVAIVTEMRAALEAVIDTEDFAPEQIASMLSAMTDGLEEIDPDVFEDNPEDDFQQSGVDDDDYDDDYSDDEDTEDYYEEDEDDEY